MKVYIVKEHYETDGDYEDYHYWNIDRGIFRTKEGAKNFINSCYENENPEINDEDFDTYSHYLKHGEVVTCSKDIGNCYTTITFTTIEEYELQD